MRIRACAVLVAALCLATVIDARRHPDAGGACAADCPVLSLQPARHFSLGATTVRVTFADFNRDGRPDIAATAHDASFVGVFFGDGAGSFGATLFLPAGNFSVPVESADFNNDGNPDLAVGSRDGFVWIYLGDGSGAFGAAQLYPAGSGEAYDIVTGDFDHDGNVDLAIGHYLGSNALTVLLGNGAGGFAFPIHYLSGLGQFIVEKADFNNDGHVDLLAATATGAAKLLLGNGAGGFTTIALSLPSTGFGIGDFDHDGKLDVVTGGPGDETRLYLGNGLGSFGAPISVASGGSGSPRAADVDGDGHLDIAVSNPSPINTISVVRGDGTGGFGPPSTYATGNHPQELGVHDLNGDGRPDFVTPNYFGGDFTVLLNDGLINDTVRPVLNVSDIVVTAPSPSGANVFYSVSSSDNSGRPTSVSCTLPSGGVFPIGVNTVTCVATDFCGNETVATFTVTVIDEPPVLALPETINATATIAAGVAVSYSATASDVVSGDVPVECTPPSGSTFAIGDTTVHCSATDGGGHSAVGNFTVRVFGCIDCVAPSFEPYRFFGSFQPTRIASADFNRDGKPDVAVTSHDGGVVNVLLGDGAGNLNTPPLVLQAGGFSVPVATGDFNGDGNPDMAVGSNEGYVWIYLGDGAGGFGAARLFEDGPGFAYDIATADFNQDGKLDLAIGLDGLAIMIGDGHGGFSLSTTHPLGAIAIVESTDLNNDGHVDLAALNHYGEYPWILLGDGAGGFVASTLPAFPYGDFNGDSRIDLVGGAPGHVLLYLADGNGGFATPVAFPVEGGVLGVADFNGDGKLDLAAGLTCPVEYDWETGEPIPSSCSDAVVVLVGDGHGQLSSPFRFGAAAGPGDMVIADMNVDGRPDIVVTGYFAGGVSVLLNTTPFPASGGGMFTTGGPTTAWIGLKNSDDVGTKFDLLVEILKNGNVVGSGQLNGVPGGSSGFNNAVARAIGSALTGPAHIGSGDTLGVRISVRIAVDVSGHASGTARLWYNDAAANSRIDTVVNGVARSFYLTSGSALSLAPGTGPKVTSDVLVKRVGGNPFKPFGTWSVVF